MDDSQSKLTKKGTPLTEFTARLSTEEAVTQGKRWDVLHNGTRLQIIDLLNRYDTQLCVSELAEVLGKTPSAVSQHLRKLKDAGVVYVEKYQTYSYYRVTSDAFDNFWDYLEGFVGDDEQQ